MTQKSNVIISSLPLQQNKAKHLAFRVRVIVFNATFNNISVISWQSVLLVEYSEKTTDQTQVTGKLYDIMFY